MIKKERQSGMTIHLQTCIFDDLCKLQEISVKTFTETFKDQN
jgi:hypothetical protein